MKYGLVLEGGSRKCLFSAGVLDCIMEAGIEFPYVIGVSAGGHAAVNFVSGQQGRLRHILNPNLLHEDPVKLLKSGVKEELRSMTYVYSYEKYPFDFQSFFNSSTECEIVATCAETGKPEYFQERQDERRLLDILNASCSVPLIFPTASVGDRHYVDGCVSNSIPYERALEKCDKALVILTKVPWDKPLDFGRMKYLMKAKFESQYPDLYVALLNRFNEYKKQTDRMWELEREGKLMIIRPEKDLCGVFDIKQEDLDDSYYYGVSVGKEKLPLIKEFMAS